MEEIITQIFFTLVCIAVFIVLNFFAMYHPRSKRQQKVYKTFTILVMVLGLVATAAFATVSLFVPMEGVVSGFLCSNLRLTYFIVTFLTAIVMLLVGLAVYFVGQSMRMSGSETRMTIHVENKVRHMTIAELGKFICRSMTHLCAVLAACGVILALETLVTSAE